MAVAPRGVHSSRSCPNQGPGIVSRVILSLHLYDVRLRTLPDKA